MNRLLATTLSALNGLLAGLIVVFGAIVGYSVSGGVIGGAIVGAFGGFVLASLSCGAIALLTLIERHLAQIAGKASSSGDHKPAHNGRERIEPTL